MILLAGGKIDSETPQQQAGRHVQPHQSSKEVGPGPLYVLHSTRVTVLVGRRGVELETQPESLAAASLSRA